MFVSQQREKEREAYIRKRGGGGNDIQMESQYLGG